MGRRIISFGIALALLTVLAAGPCLACTVNTTAGSCCHQGHCDKPTKAPTSQNCSGQDLFVATIQKANAPIAHLQVAPVPLTAVAAPAPIPMQQSITPQAVESHSPPDLYLRNSVLTI